MSSGDQWQKLLYINWPIDLWLEQESLGNAPTPHSFQRPGSVCCKEDEACAEDGGVCKDL
jgi:hypothetical protein